MFPGYVLLNMVMNDDTWYVVRNTRGVTGFVWTGIQTGTADRRRNASVWASKHEDIQVDFAEGDMVVVTGGAWKDTGRRYSSYQRTASRSVTINVELFGRETPVEISFRQKS